MYRCHPIGCLMRFRAAFPRRTWASVRRWTSWCATVAAATRPISATSAGRSAATGSGSSAHSIVRGHFRPDEVMANQTLVVCLRGVDGERGAAAAIDRTNGKKKRIWTNFHEKCLGNGIFEGMSAKLWRKCERMQRNMVIRQLLQVNELKQRNCINESEEDWAGKKRIVESVYILDFRHAKVCSTLA